MNVSASQTTFIIGSIFSGTSNFSLPWLGYSRADLVISLRIGDFI
jgi:hypothetical protein